ncbi:exopolyphosphatase [Philodulcilactobacillus myokoensis]|uniref:Exopolyphosphatase n=1 Tax=Philodulcilactobacillus myokoensis TaxID=2929573 RepID=A0A9W6B0K1_9LACO|nr:Ppx/GppA family phosphatase [Philodulcilactobacillus myokoensis]GLB46413.1 exopolyphosphatase [Philodulcilactobacillus myokoensis]
MENYCVIDLGSNTVKLTVTQIDDQGRTKNIISDKRTVRLSEDMGPEMVLKKPAIDRTIKALSDFHKEFANLPNLTVRAVATAATRMAKNKQDFIKAAEEKAKIKVDVITGNHEAYYDYLSVVNSLPVVNCVIMDSGGASTEIILVQDKHISRLTSIPLGAVTLTEKYLHTDKVSASDMFNIFSNMENLYNNMWWLHQGQNLPVVALGGSNRTLAKIQIRADNAKKYLDVHGFRMSNYTANHIFDQIISSNLEQRKQIPGLSKDRADIIVGGLTPVISLLRHLDSDRLIFSNNGLRDGILREHLNYLRSNGDIGK